MTVAYRAVLHNVQHVRRALSRVMLLRAVFVASATVLCLWLALHALQALDFTTNAASMACGWAEWVIGVAAVAALVRVFAAYRRFSREHDDVQTALWIEERSAAGAQSNFALVTLVEMLVEPRAGPSLPAPDLSLRSAPLLASAQRVLERAELPAALRTSAERQLSGPMLFTLGAVLVLVVGRVWTSDGAPSAMQGARKPAAVLALTGAVPLGRWIVRIVPPNYTRLPAQTLGNVQSVAAVSGSVIIVQGRGPIPDRVEERVLGAAADSLSSERRARRLVPRSEGSDWQVRTTARDVPVALQLTRGGTAKQLVVEGRVDSIPAVLLGRPARDSVFRTADAQMAMSAALRDDMGLSHGRFELIVSSGEGERFTARTVSLGARSFNGAISETIRATLDFAALKLVPGDIVHVRAIARDAHPLSSREFGSSETRSFRIARTAEYDSVAVEPAPPPEVDKSLMSQRMLLMLAEKLEKQRPLIEREQVLSESMKLARDQARLRLAVGDVVFQRLSGDVSGEHAHSAGDGHDHGVEQQQGKLALTGSNAGGVLAEGDDSPIIAINQPLLEAYNAMWDAGRELEQGAPRAAIPHMRLALAAIERARSAERLYLRGKPPTVIIDLTKIRMAGKDTGVTNLRNRREAIPPSEARRIARLMAAAPLAGRDPSAARDSLAVLRVEALGDAPAFAVAVGRILDTLARGGDATDSFLAARRVLGGVVRTNAGAWAREVPR